ncbi:MAG: class I SAM-dependent methyltransferase [Candidatus Dormiibacterota bacterium]
MEGSTVLEVGGGVGAVQIELLRSGARHATGVELTPTYEKAAAALLREFDLVDRVQRRIADFAQIGGEISPSDIVILNRVVCCYPDMPTLTAAAADHTRGVLVMSFPKVTWWTRALLIVGNAALRLTRRQFRIFLHLPARIRMTAELHGLRLLVDRRGSLWEVMAFEAPRTAGS